MEPEKKEIETKKEEKSNKKLIIVLYIIILIIAVGGPLIAISEQLRNNQSEVEKPNNDDDQEIDEDTPTEEDTPTLEEEPQEELEEFEDYIDIDKLLKDLKIEVTNEDKLKLVESSNTKGFMSDEFLGEMYKEKISDQYKLQYTIYFLHNKMNEAEIDYHGDNANKKISKSTLLKYAKMLFNEVEIPETLNSKLHYAFNFNFTCHKEVCTYTSEVTGLTGIVSEGFESYIYDREEQVIVDAYYVEYDNEEFKNNDFNYVYADITLKDKFDGKILKVLNDYKLQISSDDDYFDPGEIFRTLGAEIDEIPRYIFKFSEKNVLLSVEIG